MSKNFIKYCSKEANPSDMRTFKGFDLENELRLLLISDQLCSTSSATLEISTGTIMSMSLFEMKNFIEYLIYYLGYSSDSMKQPGIAHLLEHVILTASENVKIFLICRCNFLWRNQLIFNTFSFRRNMNSQTFWRKTAGPKIVKHRSNRLSSNMLSFLMLSKIRFNRKKWKILISKKLIGLKNA